MAGSRTTSGHGRLGRTARLPDEPPNAHGRKAQGRPLIPETADGPDETTEPPDTGPHRAVPVFAPGPIGTGNGVRQPARRTKTRKNSLISPFPLPLFSRIAPPSRRRRIHRPLDSTSPAAERTGTDGGRAAARPHRRHSAFGPASDHPSVKTDAPLSGRLCSSPSRQSCCRDDRTRLFPAATAGLPPKHSGNEKGPGRPPNDRKEGTEKNFFAIFGKNPLRPEIPVPDDRARKTIETYLK